MEGPELGPGGEDITWPDQVAPRGLKASSTCKIKPQTTNPSSTTGLSQTEVFGGTIGDAYATVGHLDVYDDVVAQNQVKHNHDELNQL